MKPLISVIIPIYNTEQYLCKCLDTVLSQTYTNLEIILINDGSTDDSGKICDDYAKKDSRIKVIHQSNQGVSSARNAGLSITTGEYIGFVDGDDYLKEDMFEYLYNLLKDNLSDISVCNCYNLDHKRIYINKFPKSFMILNSKEAIEEALNSFNLICMNKLFKKDLFIHELFPLDITISEDLLITFRALCKVKKIVVSNEAKYYYNRTNIQSATRQQFNVNKLSYFKATQHILDYAIKTKNNKLYKLMNNHMTYHAVGFLRQIIQTDFDDIKIINGLRVKVRKGIVPHMLSRHKLTNKLFAVCMIINFNFAKFIYQLIGKL